MRLHVSSDLTGRKAVGEAVREARTASGLSLRDAAQAMGKSHGWLGNIEQGTRALACHDLPVVAAALNTTAAAISESFSRKLSTQS